MADLTPIAVASNYSELKDVIRSRADELKFTRADLDAVAGLTDGHASKLLSPKALPAKVFGPVSLGAILASLGLRLVVAVDHELTEQAKRRVLEREGRCDFAVSEAHRLAALDWHAARRAAAAEAARERDTGAAAA